ncbi:glycerol-3-phosphate dehydrogenase [Metamycoplasma arthritidis]|uniref:Glycerol-3-phosphate dehydrogenase n=1 Tax=Metamycoplasma arthritidis (strain 158L3-1) TaxID=243272 RepID=B3PME3_META1|nr:NAD(P)H-dependent glycerol-3-phosphate dehydrogenase [Metamycoplasma arthritidis]ACF07195.1 NAD-dependent glycerol-3-phosphate dehydrogenase [Metamycoplasma arthritidis 158L3-1]VEU78719.1 glycerol-3-phosphate dehydrogenase [Metamycoplasma arthritidis]
MKNKIVIIGSGAMGTACATILADNDQNVVIYGVDEQEIQELRSGKNTKYFGSIDLPYFKATTNLQEALVEAEFVLMAVPTKAYEAVYSEVVQNLTSQVILINVSKGFWPNTSLPVHEVLELKNKIKSKITGVVSLIGPSFAIDMVNKSITLVSAVSASKIASNRVAKLFSNEYFRVYRQNDVRGAFVGAIYKNILAIANGMLDGLEFTNNTQAALIARGVSEMLRYNKIVGGKNKTLFGLTGIGDLVLTALSSKSRNYTFGKNFIQNQIGDENITIEGKHSIKIIYEKYVATKVLRLPIIEALYQVIFDHQDPLKIIKNLMKKPIINE